MDIICRERSCVYNKGFCCTKDIIKIGEKINCTSYKKNEETKELQDTSRHIFGKNPPKYKAHRESKYGSIECNANCMFCKNHICESNGITINSIKNMPFCASYFKK